ncbi:hypothetical protein C0993_009629, partial [Termitomyces sp. T159_Od127]
HPSAVIAAEKAIWRVIFNVSLGQDVIKELKLTLENVKDAMSTMVPQWIAIAGMPEPVKVWTRVPAMDVESQASHLSLAGDRPCQPLRTNTTLDVDEPGPATRCSGLVGERSKANNNFHEPGTSMSAAESNLRRYDNDCPGAAREGGMDNDNELDVETPLAGHATMNEVDNVGANREGTGGVANDNEPGIDIPPSAAHQTEDDDLEGVGEGGVINDNKSSGTEHAHQTEDDGNEDEIPPSPTEPSHHGEDNGLLRVKEMMEMKTKYPPLPLNGDMVDIGHEAGEGGVIGTSGNVDESGEAIGHEVDYMNGEAGKELLSQLQPILDFDLSTALLENIRPLSTELLESNRQLTTIDPTMLLITCCSPLTSINSTPSETVEHRDLDQPVTRNATRHLPESTSDQVLNKPPLEMEAS